MGLAGLLMQRIKLGICLSSLGLPLRPALEAASRLGVGGVEIEATGDLAPQNLSQTGRREFLHRLRGLNLSVIALKCLLRHGLNTAENLQPRIDHVQQVMSLSYELGARIVVVQAGRVPEKPDDRAADFLTDSLTALGRHGDQVGAVLALETGLERGETLRAFLDRFDTGGLGVAYDPANLLMNGHDPYAAARALRERIVHAHAKDARSAGTSRAAQEVPLGHGDLDWLQLLALLEEIDYHGWLAVARESGASRAVDVAAGVTFLRRLGAA